MSTVVAAGHVLIGAKVGPALAGMARANAAFAATGKKGAATGKLLSKAISAPIVLGFAYAIKAAADFESSLNDMQAVSGATDAQMKQVSATAKQLGADTKLPGTSAKDAAEAMVQLAKGGMTAKQSMDAARGTLMLAAAAGIENAQAAEIQSDTLNAFAMKAGLAGKVADVLAASANASTAEITDMAQSLQQSATVAHQAGMGLTETAVAISMMANEGIKGSDAGTSLKTMLMRLQAPIGNGAKAIAEYGLRLRDASGELRPLPQLAKEFQDKLGGLSKAHKDAAMAAIFGSDAIRAGNILLSKSKADYAALTAQISANGAAQKLAEAKMKGFNGSLEAFKSTVETAAITIGQILLPMATKIVQKITEWASAFDRLSPAQQRAAVEMLALAAAVGPAVLVFSKLQGLTGGLGFSLGGLGGPLGLAAALFGAAAMSSDQARANFMRIGQAVAPMAQALASVASSPITLFMVGAGAAALGLVRAFVALRTALAALTVAAATNPFGAFVVGAGLVIGAIVGLTTQLGGGAASMRTMADATKAAKDALDALKGATLGVEQASLSHKAALLEVKAAQQGLVTTQAQVDAGHIKGQAATNALAQANLRLDQANLNVKRSSADVASAMRTETKETASANAASQQRIATARAIISQAKNAIAIYGSTSQNLARLRDAEHELHNAQKQAAGSAATLTSKIRDSSGQVTTLKGATSGLPGKLQAAQARVAALNADLTNFVSAGASAAGAAFGVGAGIGDGLAAGIASRIGAVAAAAANLVSVAMAAARAAAKTKSPSKETIKIGQDVGAGFALGITAKAGAAKSALAKVVRDAVMSARQNAGSLASSLGSSITAGIDALTGRRLAALGNSPEAQRLRAIQAQQREENAAREKARLQDAINSAETDQDRQSAIQDLSAWELDQQRQALEDQLAASEAAINAEADARKTAAERGLADLTDSFNRGLISQQQFNDGLQALLAASGVDYAALGDLLGSSFANGFQDALDGLKAQIALLAGWAGISLPGAETTDPFAAQMEQWRNRRKTLSDNLADAKKAARQSSSPGGTKVTKAEQNRIDNAQSALTDWDKRKPVRAALGGIIRGFGLRDSVPALLQPGEGVLSHRGMDALVANATGRGGGAGRGETHYHFHVTGNTILGDDRTVGRRLAEIVGPEINRRITLAA